MQYNYFQIIELLIIKSSRFYKILCFEILRIDKSIKTFQQL